MNEDRQPQAAIELERVVKDFGRERVLDKVDLTVPDGRITVLMGPSGAGKTVTIKHILGLLKPTAGSVRVWGRDLGSLTDEELNEVRRSMAVVMQGALPFTCGLFYSLNVYENVAYPLRERTRMSPEQVHEVTMEHLELVGLKDRATDMPDVLSAGMAKRTAIARALALDARIVIIDDFDSGLDGVRLALLCEILEEVQLRRRSTFLVTTHDMTAARQLADHAAVIHEGRIVESGVARDVFGSRDAATSQLIAGDTAGSIKMSPG